MKALMTYSSNLTQKDWPMKYKAKEKKNYWFKIRVAEVL